MNGFRVDWVFPEESDFLAGEIRFEGQVICRIKCERTDYALEVEFFEDRRVPPRVARFSLPDFMQLLLAVGDEVRDLRRGIRVPASLYPICLRGMQHAVNDA